MQNDRALLLYNNIASLQAIDSSIKDMRGMQVVGVANLCEIGYSQFKWDLVVWRQVSSHQKTCAITLQSKVVTQRLRVLHADPLYDHLTTITTCS